MRAVAFFAVVVTFLFGMGAAWRQERDSHPAAKSKCDREWPEGRPEWGECVEREMNRSGIDVAWPWWGVTLGLCALGVGIALYPRWVGATKRHTRR